MLKKFLVAIFIFTNLLAFSEENGNIINREVSGINKQKLDVREITTEELILKNQDLEMTSIDISGRNFKEKDDKIRVNKNDNKNLKEELAKGLKKSFFDIFD